MDIKNMDKNELEKLKKEIALREKVIEEEKRNEERKKAEKIIELIKQSDIIDLMQHSRTSCSDKNPSNGFDSSRGYAGCAKCHLMEILEDHENGIHDFSISIDVSISKI